jgi:hypothetical protein
MHAQEREHMRGQCVVALYRSRGEAERASLAVREAGITDDNIRISDESGKTRLSAENAGTVAPEIEASGL